MKFECLKMRCSHLALEEILMMLWAFSHKTTAPYDKFSSRHLGLHSGAGKVGKRDVAGSKPAAGKGPESWPGGLSVYRVRRCQFGLIFFAVPYRDPGSPYVR